MPKLIIMAPKIQIQKRLKLTKIIKKGEEIEITRRTKSPIYLRVKEAKRYRPKECQINKSKQSKKGQNKKKEGRSQKMLENRLENQLEHQENQPKNLVFNKATGIQAQIGFLTLIRLLR